MTIHGDLDLCREQVSLRSMENAIKHSGEAYMLELSAFFESQGHETQETPPPKIQGILEQHQDVFQMPNALPPARYCEHAITLQEGTEPINLRPYMYSYGQKMK